MSAKSIFVGACAVMLFFAWAAAMVIGEALQGFKAILEALAY
jgi:hypothetical protein